MAQVKKAAMAAAFKKGAPRKAATKAAPAGQRMSAEDLATMGRKAR